MQPKAVVLYLRSRRRTRRNRSHAIGEHFQTCDTPKRLQRMRLRLQKFTPYKKGSQMYLADTLNRAYIKYDEGLNKPSAKQEVHKVDIGDVMYSDSIILPEDKLAELHHAYTHDGVMCELARSSIFNR